jgi:hypothetical protein
MMTSGGFTIGESCGRAGLVLAIRRQPHARRGRIWQVAAGALLVTGLAAGAVWSQRTPLFRISRVQISPYRYSEKADLEGILRSALGHNLWSFDPTALRKRLEALPWVEKAELRRRPPQDLQVKITEWQPLLVVAAADGQSPQDRAQDLVLLESGKIVRWPAHLPPATQPILRYTDPVAGNSAGTGLLTASRVRALLELMKAVATTGLEAACPIDFVVITDSGFALDMRGERRRLLLGQGDFAERLHLFLEVKDKVADGPVIDLRFRNRLNIHNDA